MNSLRTLQALNQVVNHDICPQMKTLIAENKRLVAKNNRLIKGGEYLKKVVKEMTERVILKNEIIMELDDWKLYMLLMDYFRCNCCKNINPYETGDEEDNDGEHICCYECVTKKELAESIIENTTPPPPPELCDYIRDIVVVGGHDISTDPNFEFDANLDGNGWKFTGAELSND